MLVCSRSFYRGSTGSQCQRNQSKCCCVLEVSTLVLQEVNGKGIRVSVAVITVSGAVLGVKQRRRFSPS